MASNDDTSQKVAEDNKKQNQAVSEQAASQQAMKNQNQPTPENKPQPEKEKDKKESLDNKLNKDMRDVLKKAGEGLTKGSYAETNMQILKDGHQLGQDARSVLNNGKKIIANKGHDFIEKMAKKKSENQNDIKSDKNAEKKVELKAMDNTKSIELKNNANASALNDKSASATKDAGKGFVDTIKNAFNSIKPKF